MVKKPFKSATVNGKNRQRLEPKTLDDSDFTAVSETHDNLTPCDEITDESMFDVAVLIASNAMDEFYELYGKTPAEFYYKKYNRLPTTKQKLKFFFKLVAGAYDFREEYDGLLLICENEVLDNSIPLQVRIWMIDYIKGKLPPPSKNSPRKNLHRDIAILIGMHIVIKLGLTPTRNDERKEPFNSAADVVANAAGTTYFNVKRIWHASENPNSPTYSYIPDELRRSGVALHDKNLNLCQPPKGYL